MENRHQGVLRPNQNMVNFEHKYLLLILYNVQPPMVLTAQNNVQPIQANNS